MATSRHGSRKRARPSKEITNTKRPCPQNKTTDVSVRIAEQLLMNKTHTESNVVFCPVSINILLSLLAAGSGGETLDQFLDFLGAETLEDVNSFASKLISVVSPSKGDSGGGPQLSFASGVWLDRSLSFRHSFKQVVDSVHNATALESVDFQNKAEEVTKDVNLWVEKETSGFIKEAIPPGKINGRTRLVLANALYFKGKWEEPFKASRTKLHDFHLLNGSTVQVPFMTDNNSYQLLGRYNGFNVLKLPYEQDEDNRQFSMCFYLPHAKDGLPDLIEKLSSERDFFGCHVPSTPKRIRKFWIPKFKIAFDFEAPEVLKSLGLVLPFSATEADFTKMFDSPNGEITHITDIFHKSVVEVNEEGTVAVGYSGSVTGGCRTPPKSYDFVADHPFLFIIREDTAGVVLFIGSVVNPSAPN